MKLLDWILGREPVATGTGIAVVVTAALGLAAAFGMSITPEQIAAIGALVTALAGFAARAHVSPVLTPAERQVRREIESTSTPPIEGQLGIIVAIVVVLILAMIGLFSVCGDDDENGMGPRHHDCDPYYEDCYGSPEGRGGDGGESGGHQGYGGGGGRSGDYDGGPGDDCRNACGNTIIVPTPGGGRER